MRSINWTVCLPRSRLYRTFDSCMQRSASYRVTSQPSCAVAIGRTSGYHFIRTTTDYCEPACLCSIQAALMLQRPTQPSAQNRELPCLSGALFDNDLGFCTHMHMAAEPGLRGILEGAHALLEWQVPGLARTRHRMYLQHILSRCRFHYLLSWPDADCFAYRCSPYLVGGHAGYQA